MIRHENPLLFGWFGDPMITGVVLFFLFLPDFGKALDAHDRMILYRGSMSIIRSA